MEIQLNDKSSIQAEEIVRMHADAFSEGKKKARKILEFVRNRNIWRSKVPTYFKHDVYRHHDFIYPQVVSFFEWEMKQRIISISDKNSAFESQ